MEPITVSGKAIGPGHPTFVIAEIGFNHEGKVDLGIEMIEAAASAGADAVKFQSYVTNQLSQKNWEHFELVRHGELDFEAHRRLAEAARDAGVIFFSTPFGAWALDRLKELRVPLYKIASMDVTNIPLISEVASIGKPTILSTGMATLGEIATAVETFFACGNDQLILLHCISKYPPEPADANLRTMLQIGDAFQLPVGYSDHLLGNTVAQTAVALGACVIEKHFTTDKSLPGPDHKISADADDLTSLVQEIRLIESALGRRAADPSRADRANAKSARRGLYAARDIKAGTAVTADDIKIVRPEGRFGPTDLSNVLGRIARRDIREDAALSAEDI